VNTTLDQWEVLEAVVELGSFAAAATKMNRSQSTISYAVARLQEHFKIPLLELKGRKARLTETGKALLADAEPLLTGFRALEQRGASLAAGGEKQIHLSVDSVFPDDRLFAILTDFSKTFPHVYLKLHRGTLLSTALEFANFGADICVAGTPTGEHMIKPILDIRMRAVARPDHPLAESKRQLTRMDLIQRLAVIIEGATDPERRRQPHSPSQRHLAVGSIESAIEAVRPDVPRPSRFRQLLARKELSRRKIRGKSRVGSNLAGPRWPDFCNRPSHRTDLPPLEFPRVPSRLNTKCDATPSHPKMILRASASGSFSIRISLSQTIVLFVSGSEGSHLTSEVLGLPLAANAAHDEAIFFASA
jgi:DNA-binding transcriptional LysR family regulator